MDIARLGVGIDPSGAVAGSRRVQDALRQMGDQATTQTKRVDQGATKAGQSLTRMASQAKGGFLDMTRGLMDAADAAGILNNGFGAMLRRADSAIRAAQQLGAMHRATATAATANATATTAAGAATAEMGAATAAAGISLGGIAAIAAAAAAAILALVAAFSAINTAINLIGQGMKLAGPVQQTTRSLQILTGSASEAKRVMDELRRGAIETGGSLEGSMSTVKRFLALGFSPDNAIKLNNSILDVAGAVGLTEEEAKGLGAALAQVQAKGVVSMEELRQQIAEKGVPVFDELAKKLGVTTAELNKMVGDGKVASKELIDIFLNLEGGFAKFAGGAKKQTENLPGAVSRLRNVWEEFLRLLGEPINDAVTPLINRLSDLLTTLLPLAARIGNAIATGITALVKAVETGQIGELLALTLSAAIEQAASFYVTIFQAQTMAVANYIGSLFMAPITKIAGFLFDTVATVLEFLAKIVTLDFSGAFKTVTKFFAGLFEDGSGIVKNIAAALYNGIGQAFEDAVNAFYIGFMKVWQKATNLMSAGLLALGMDPMAPVAIPGKVDVFTPVKIQTSDLTKASDKLVGTGARDALKAKIAELGWKPELMGPEKPFEDPKTPEDPKTGDSGSKGDKAAKDAVQRAEAVETATSRMLDEWGNLAGQIDNGIANIGQSISGNLGEALTSLIQGTKSFGQAFSEMASAVVSDILRIIVQMTVQLAIQRALAAAGYGGLANFQIAHAGGTVGATNLPKYHAGGTPPLSSEANVRVDRGETILTRRRASELASELRAARGQKESGKTGNQGTATIINVLDRSEIADAVARNPQAVVNAMSRNLPAVRKMVMTGQRA